MEDVYKRQVFAILVVKQLFGGLGQNFMNPALGARCFLLISFTGRMTTFVYDGVSGATPLAQLKAGESVNTFDMLIGNTAGTIGETSVIAIMIGAIFLLLMGVIDLRTVSYTHLFLDGTDFLFFSETSGTVCKDEHLGRKNDRESGGTGI